MKQKNVELGFTDKRGATAYTSLSSRTLDTARAKGVLPFYKFGRRRVLFKFVDLDGWLAGMRVDLTRDRETAGEGSP